MNDMMSKAAVERGLRALDPAKAVDREVLSIYSWIMVSLEAALGERSAWEWIKPTHLEVNLFASKEKFFLNFLDTKGTEFEFEYSSGFNEKKLVIKTFLDVFNGIERALSDEFKVPFFHVCSFDEERVKEGKYKGCYSLRVEVNICPEDGVL